MMAMRIQGIERVALQAKDLDTAMALFSSMLDTTFHQQELGGEQRRLAFSPLGIELLQEVPPGDFEGLRSVHLRAEDWDEARRHVMQRGGAVLAEFRIGEMSHLITRIGCSRISFVEYSGDDGLAALSAEQAVT
jgi:predicted enzyme related to lactoylglutathione lyase